MLTAGLVAGAILAAIWYLPGEPPEHVEGPAFVVDGDSLEILGTAIRLAGLDAPEARQSCRREGRDWDCGQAAAQALTRRIAGRRVACTTIRRDRYARILAECFVAGDNLNTWLVREGWAVASGRYLAAEASAREAKRGLWAGEFERPADWRKKHPR